MVFEHSLLQEIGIYEYGIIDTDQIVFLDEVRTLCEQNVCRKYGTSWACPPAIGTLNECIERCLEYEKGLVFTSKYNLRSPFDVKGMMFGHDDFKKISDRLYELVKENLSDFLLLSNEGCKRCSECTYPDNPCRFPEKLFPSVEGFGIIVNKLGKSANLKYDNGEGTVTYFGMLLFND